MPENEPIAEPLQEVHLGPAEILVPEPPTPIEPAMVSIAPVWHTLVLIIGILGLSIAGSTGLTSQRHGSNRLITYGATAGMEILMLGWVALGLWLQKVPFKVTLRFAGQGRAWSLPGRGDWFCLLDRSDDDPGIDRSCMDCGRVCSDAS